MANKALILGGGIAGLLAYHELKAQGWSCSIHTDALGNFGVGAFFLRDLPGSRKLDQFRTEPDHTLLWGQGYLYDYEQKCWDRMYGSSFPTESRVEQGWWVDTTRTYHDRALAHYLLDIDLQDLVIQRHVLNIEDGTIVLPKVAEYFDLVVLTFPPVEMAGEAVHDFYKVVRVQRTTSQQYPLLQNFWNIAAILSVQKGDMYTDLEGRVGSVMYDGRSNSPVTRASASPTMLRRGEVSLELARGVSSIPIPQEHIVDSMVVRKMSPAQVPHDYSVLDLPNKLLIVGRFALGDKGYLSHQVLEDVREVVS